MIGAGPTGVELAGQIAELAHRVLPRDYRSMNTREREIILLDAGPGGPRPVRPEAAAVHAAELEKMGVEVRLNTAAIDMDHDSITVKGPDGE